MKSKTIFKALLLFVSLTALKTASYSQEGLKTLTISEYKVLLLAAQEGQDAKDSLAVYKSLYAASDTALLAARKEITRKEGVIVRTQEQRNTCYNAKDTLVSISKKLEFVNRQQQQYIQVLEQKRPSKWGLVVSAGYGYQLGSVATRGVVVSAGIGYKLF